MGPKKEPFIWNEIKENESKKNKQLSTKIKAIYQQYINALIDNRMIP